MGVETADTGAGLELRLVFENLRDGLRVKRVYVAYPQVALVETWTELESMLGRSTTVSDLTPLQVTVDGALITTVDGLGGPAETGGPFALQHRALARPPIRSSSRNAAARRSATCRSSRWRRPAARSSPA